MRAPDDAERSAAIERLVPRLVEIRHDLHRHPELGFEEHRTQSVVRAWLEQHGYTPHETAETGLYADLHPELVGHRTTVGLRADLDALPIDETTAIPHRSVHPGRAHKCGHDGHTAILLGVAALLAERRASIPGNVRLLFQPAEEGVRGGGAKVMVAEGVLDPVDEVYALHNWPAYPRGEIRVRSGALMAQTDSMHIEVKGEGGHGSQPQDCRDPIVAAAHLVCALQTVISRGLGHEGGAVLSICQFQAGSTTNVIPDRAHLAGTIRTFAPEVTARVMARFRELAGGIARAFGVEIAIDLDEGYPVLVNDPVCTEAVERVGARVVGPEHVTAAALPMAGGEDFAYMTRATRGAYFFLGTGEGARTGGPLTPGCHHPDFDFDDSVIPLGIRMMLGLVDDRLR